MKTADSRSGRTHDRVMAGEPLVRILELVQSAPNDRIKGHFRVRQADASLELVGWVLGIDCRAERIEVSCGSAVVARATPVHERPDIAAAFPAVDGAASSGFQLAIEPSGQGESHLEIEAVLEDGKRAPLGELLVETGKRLSRRA